MRRYASAVEQALLQVNPMSKRLKFVGAASLCLYLVACGPSDQSKDDKNKASTDASAIVTVNGEPITQQDIDLLVDRMFSEADVLMGSDALKDKVIESLVTSRAIKQKALQELDSAEAEKIRQQARAYEEELFVKAYLKNHATPEPVTIEMVQQYYEAHPESFGEEKIRSFELLRAPANVDELVRDNILKSVASIKATKDWPQAAKEWSDKFQLQFQQGRAKKGLLEPELEAAITKMQKGDTSDIFYIDGQLHLARVIDIQTIPPKPLSEVSADIRRQLAPLQLKKAIKKVSESVRSQSKIEWKKQDN